jgi:serine protease
MRKRAVCLGLVPCFFMFISLCSAAPAKAVPGEIIIKFKPGISEKGIRKVISAHGASVLYTSPFAGFKRIKLSGAVSVDRVINQLRKHPNVEYVVPNSIAHAHLVPNDSYYTPYQWNFDDQAPGGNPYGGANGGGINLEPAWDISTGSGVVVAILDTGVAYEDYGIYRKAPDLAYTSFAPGWDFVNKDAHPNDDHSHGTHVTGTIAQNTNNGIGVAGVAFNCSIMPVKVLNKNGEGTLQQLVDGIYYAVDHGADVINMSLGWPPGYDPGQPLKDALDYAYDNGLTVVCSSGNDAAGTVSYPAAYWTTIAVGATRYDETRPSYSNYGEALDLSAPGGDLSVDQNGDEYGDGILQNTFNPATKRPGDFGYWFFNGTSMAAPHVSGVAALLIARGVATPDEVRYALQSTAEDKGAPGWDSEYGWGIVDAYAALNADLTAGLSDDQLMSLGETYVGPYPGFAGLVGKTDVPGTGVEYDVALYGAWGIDIWIGGPPPQPNLSAYSHYSLTFTNTSVDDTFSANLYLKTGPDETYYGSYWVTLGPGMSWTLSFDLGGVGNLDDVKEIGFGLTAWKGSAWGYADAILVEVEGETLTE